MMIIELAVNRQRLLRFEILNRGPEADATGPVRYEWAADDGSTGELVHHPDDGAVLLAGAVLDDYRAATEVRWGSQ